MSGSCGSTAIFSKYQPRPHSAWSLLTRRQVAPASSERNTPPCPGGGGAGRPGAGGWGLGAGDVGSGTRQSTPAYTRRGFDGATAMPVRPIPSAGRPVVSWCQVEPPSMDLWIPPPGPLVGAYVNHGGRRVFHSPAYTTRASVGSMTTSTAPTFSSLSRTFCQVRPPSRERNTPRSGFAAYRWPIAATKTTSGFLGST